MSLFGELLRHGAAHRRGRVPRAAVFPLCRASEHDDGRGEPRRARKQRVEVRDVLHEDRAPARRSHVRERRLEPRQRRAPTRGRAAQVPPAERARRVREDA